MSSPMSLIAVVRANPSVGIGQMTESIKSVLAKYGSGARVEFTKLNGGHNIFHVRIPATRSSYFNDLFNDIGPADNDFLQFDKFVIYKWINKAPKVTEKKPVDISRIGYSNVSSTWTSTPLDPSILVLRLPRKK